MIAMFMREKIDKARNFAILAVRYLYFYTICLAGIRINYRVRFVVYWHSMCLRIIIVLLLCIVSEMNGINLE